MSPWSSWGNLDNINKWHFCVCQCRWSLKVFVCVLCLVHLQERLEEYIKQWNGLVKLFRNEKREGLIQARSIGARKATLGQVWAPLLTCCLMVLHKCTCVMMCFCPQVLIYLDAHCEVGINWYAPLVAPISKDRYDLSARLILCSLKKETLKKFYLLNI